MQPPDVFPTKGIVLVDLRVLNHVSKLSTNLIQARAILRTSDTGLHQLLTNAASELAAARRYINTGKYDTNYQQFKKRSGALCDGCNDLRKVGERAEKLAATRE